MPSKETLIFSSLSPLQGYYYLSLYYSLFRCRLLTNIVESIREELPDQAVDCVVDTRKNIIHVLAGFEDFVELCLIICRGLTDCSITVVNGKVCRKHPFAARVHFLIQTQEFRHFLIQEFYLHA